MKHINYHKIKVKTFSSATNPFPTRVTVKIFEIICNKSPDIVHRQTVHRILGVCCLIVAKFYYDGYNSLHFGQVLGVKKEKLILMESFLFLDVLEGKLNFIKNDNNEKMMME